MNIKTVPRTTTIKNELIHALRNCPEGEEVFVTGVKTNANFHSIASYYGVKVKTEAVTVGDEEGFIVTLVE
jgi:hypothetical protein